MFNSLLQARTEWRFQADKRIVILPIIRQFQAAIRPQFAVNNRENRLRRTLQVVDGKRRAGVKVFSGTKGRAFESHRGYFYLSVNH
jgi:hypothetical protein